MHHEINITFFLVLFLCKQLLDNLHWRCPSASTGCFSSRLSPEVCPTSSSHWASQLMSHKHFQLNSRVHHIPTWTSPSGTSGSQFTQSPTPEHCHTLWFTYASLWLVLFPMHPSQCYENGQTLQTDPVTTPLAWETLPGEAQTALHYDQRCLSSFSSLCCPTDHLRLILIQTAAYRVCTKSISCNTILFSLCKWRKICIPKIYLSTVHPTLLQSREKTYRKDEFFIHSINTQSAPTLCQELGNSYINDTWIYWWFIGCWPLFSHFIILISLGLY